MQPWLFALSFPLSLIGASSLAATQLEQAKACVALATLAERENCLERLLGSAPPAATPDKTDHPADAKTEAKARTWALKLTGPDQISPQHGLFFKGEKAALSLTRALDATGTNKGSLQQVKSQLFLHQDPKSGDRNQEYRPFLGLAWQRSRATPQPADFKPVELREVSLGMSTLFGAAPEGENDKDVEGVARIVHRRNEINDTQLKRLHLHASYLFADSPGRQQRIRQKLPYAVITPDAIPPAEVSEQGLFSTLVPYAGLFLDRWEGNGHPGNRDLLYIGARQEYRFGKVFTVDLSRFMSTLEWRLFKPVRVPDGQERSSRRYASASLSWAIGTPKQGTFDTDLVLKRSTGYDLWTGLGKVGTTSLSLSVSTP